MDFCISLKANFDRKTIKMQKCWLHCDTFYFSDMHWISFASIRLFLKAGYIVALYFYAKLTSLQFIFFVKVGFTALQFFFCQSWLPCKTNLFIFVKVGFTALQFFFFVKVRFPAKQIYFFCQSWLPCKTNLFFCQSWLHWKTNLFFY